jgi:hypothetical protein
MRSKTFARWRLASSSPEETADGSSHEAHKDHKDHEEEFDNSLVFVVFASFVIFVPPPWRVSQAELFGTCPRFQIMNVRVNSITAAPC